MSSCDQAFTWYGQMPVGDGHPCHSHITPSTSTVDMAMSAHKTFWCRHTDKPAVCGGLDAEPHSFFLSPLFLSQCRLLEPETLGGVA